MFRKVDLPSHISGQLYLHSMPCRYESLDQFTQWLEDADINRIVCLVSEQELSEKSPIYATLVGDNCFYTKDQLWPMEQLTIPDFGIPVDTEHPESTQQYYQMIWNHTKSIEEGDNVLLHCAGGVGRTGMTAILLLRCLGLSSLEASNLIEQAGSGPETDEQINFCMDGTRPTKPGTPFGAAVIDAAQKQESVDYNITVDGHSMIMPANDFTGVVDGSVEHLILDRLDLKHEDTIMDWGCGIGRHYTIFLQPGKPVIRYIGLEKCYKMLTYAEEHHKLSPQLWYLTTGSFESDLDRMKSMWQEFNAILLMGNGLGLLGNEEQARKRLKLLVDALAPGGTIVLESCQPPNGRDYVTNTIAISVSKTI